MQTPANNSSSNVNRRNFLKTASTAVAGTSLLGTLSIERSAFAASTDTLKLALIGCGGRGSGAADQALSTEGPVKLVAMADVFKDRLENSLNSLKGKHADRVDVPEDRQFIGWDAYKQAIAAADVVILATPPGFRPMLFEEAVRQGKHIFAEKPVATDPPGIRRFLAAAEESKKKNLKVVIGLQRHYDEGYRETIQRLHDGAIGDIVAMRCYWDGQPPWVRRRADLEQQAGRKLTEMEYQMRNWYYFVWLCGDHIVEQHIHNIDVINWVKKGYPVRAQGHGGCEVRKGPDYGQIFDHHAVEFEYADGSRCFSYCRHINGCWDSVSEHVIGTKGTSDVNSHIIRAEHPWRFKKAGKKNPYQVEHDELFAAIRNDKPINDAERGAMSTMTAILGRLSTYSGKMIEWDDAIKSNLTDFPDKLAWDAAPKPAPDANGLYQRAVPGQTVVI
ncbi:MAG TPA: Gfo/Idh/MocA family oxidoreductase [Verrucomicrobiae bacterium]|nr:Gfo/Idh/MocA family oxidoreductase [Verrucomicrobiae bacterium]